MARWFIAVALLLLVVAGCGSSEMGPADPSSTPTVTEEERNQSLEQGYNSMSPEARKQYEKMYGKDFGQPGGGGGSN